MTDKLVPGTTYRGSNVLTIHQIKAERDVFEHWYITNAFHYERDPIGSKDCALQWQAWLARAECVSSAERVNHV
jgi:hypothetical protein